MKPSDILLIVQLLWLLVAFPIGWHCGKLEGNGCIRRGWGVWVAVLVSTLPLFLAAIIIHLSRRGL